MSGFVSVRVEDVRPGDLILSGAALSHARAERVYSVGPKDVRGEPGLLFRCSAGDPGYPHIAFQLGEPVRCLRQPLRDIPRGVLEEELARRAEYSKVVDLLSKLEGLSEEDPQETPRHEIVRRLELLTEEYS